MDSVLQVRLDSEVKEALRRKYGKNLASVVREKLEELVEPIKPKEKK